MNVPEALRARLAGYDCERTQLGCEAETYRLHASGRPTLYLKIAADLGLRPEIPSTLTLTWSWSTTLT